MMDSIRRDGRVHGLSPDQRIFSRLDGPAPADGGCSSRWAVFFEVLRCDQTGVCETIGSFPNVRLNAPPMFSVLGVSRDRGLLVVVVKAPVFDAERYFSLWRAVRRMTDARLHDLGLRAENLKDGRNRPGLLLDPAGSPEIPARHPRAVIDDVQIDSRLYFSAAPLLTVEEWIERAALIEDPPPVLIPAPQSRERGIFGRIASVFQGGG